MEANMIVVPFDLEMAKKIEKGDLDGKIITREGMDARIICWDVMNEKYPIAAAFKVNDIKEKVDMFTSTGKLYDVDGDDDGDDEDLFLKIPEYTQFKDGDIVYCETTDVHGDCYKWIAMLKGDVGYDKFVVKGIFIEEYVSLEIGVNEDTDKLTFGDYADNIESIRLATKEEREMLMKVFAKESMKDTCEGLKKVFERMKNNKQ